MIEMTLPTWVFRQIQKRPGITSKQLYAKTKQWPGLIDEALKRLRDEGKIQAVNKRWYARRLTVESEVVSYGHRNS